MQGEIPSILCGPDGRKEVKKEIEAIGSNNAGTGKWEIVN